MNTPAETVVSVKTLQRQLQGQTILNNINVHIEPGDVIGLVGKNGAGKTTLLETLLGFGYPAFGEVRLWGEPATELSNEAKQKIGFVPQRDELLSTMNGREHLKLYRALRSRWNQALVDRLCEEWEIPLQRMAHKMSEGERQKLSIVLAMAHEPELLVLDEPVASLDPLARRQFLQQLIEIATDHSRAIVFSSHIVTDLERVANRVWLLHGGSLAWSDGLDELKESVVRVQLHADGPLETRPTIEGLLTFTTEPRGASLVCKDWDSSKRAQLAEQTGADLEIAHLSLEDIFLYFGRAKGLAKEGRDLK